jgi:hypothetical protein
MCVIEKPDGAQSESGKTETNAPCTSTLDVTLPVDLRAVACTEII